MSEPELPKIFLQKIHRAGVLPAVGITILCFLSLACSKGSTPVPPSQTENPPAPLLSRADDKSLNQLFGHIWRVTKAPSAPAFGSIYVFLPNGMLLETSCMETYRIATWSSDKASPRELRVVEDKQLAFTANIAVLSDSTLRLEKNLVRGKEKQEVTYAAVEGEFVCPDLPR